MGITTIDFESASRNSAASGRARRLAEAAREIPSADVVQWFLDYYWIRHPISTEALTHYQRDLLAAATWLDSSRKKTLLTANEQDLREYLRMRNEAGSEQSNLPSLSCIKRFYFYLVELGIRRDDPTEHLYVRTPRIIRHNLEVVRGKRT